MANTFTPQDFGRLQTANEEVAEFLDFVLDRFKVYALATTTLDVDGRIKQGGGYVSFRVERQTVFDENKDDITIIEHTDDDRGPGSSRVHTLPKTALFERTERETDLEAYLALKEKLGL